MLEDPERFGGRTVATIICGGNITPADFHLWVLDLDPSPTMTAPTETSPTSEQEVIDGDRR